MIIYAVMIGKTEIVTEEGAEAIFLAREQLQQNKDISIFIEVRHMSEEEFLKLKEL